MYHRTSTIIQHEKPEGVMMKIVVELVLQEGTVLNDFQPAQIGCAIGRLKNALAGIGIHCASSKLTITRDEPTTSPPHSPLRGSVVSGLPMRKTRS